MTSIGSVSILGAGAMGAAYAAMFSDAGDFSVSFVARGARYQRLSQNALMVNGKRYTVAVEHPDRVAQSSDLIIVALKHHHLADALPDLKHLVDDHTIILSVMNGLESEEIIGARYGMEKMVYAIAVAIDAVHEDDRYTYGDPGKIIFGLPSAGKAYGRLERLQEALNRAAIPNEISGDIQRDLWWKFMINVGINQASAVLGAPYRVFQTSPDAMALMKLLMAEVVNLAQPAGIDLTGKDIEAWCRILSGLSPQGKTSMLQDMEAGRKTEVEIFAGKVVSLGAQYQVPTPVNSAVLHIIKALESKYLREPP